MLTLYHNIKKKKTENYNMIKNIFALFALSFCLTRIFPQDFVPPKNPDLLISVDDIRVEKAGGGYNLFVRKKPRLESIMLAETTKDPLGKESSYAYRAKEYNSVNGDEIRMLDGNVLDKNSSFSPFSLVDSTPQDDAQFGRAFLIFIPDEIVYGYEWGRHGTVKIGKGTFINIRAFEKKYCDYSGGAETYFDNPYMFDLERRKFPRVEIEEVAQKADAAEDVSEVVLTDDYNPIAADKFKEISDMMIYSKGPDSLIDDISAVLDAIDPKNLVDVVFAIDATGSMKDDIELLREKLISRLQEKLEAFGDVRFGLLFYRDYGDNFNTRGLPVKQFDFTNNFEEFSKNLNSIKIRGTEGGDIPEAVYEALFACMDFYKWRGGATKKVILIGDAEPHPTPRRSGKYSKELVEKTAAERGISVSAIITPDDKARRGR